MTCCRVATRRTHALSCRVVDEVRFLLLPFLLLFFFLFFLNYSIFSFVSCARLSSTELCSSSNEIILTGSSFRLILSPVGRRIFYVSRCARPFSFLSRSTRPRWCESDSRKIFPRPSFEFLRTPPFSLSISRTRRGDPLEIVCNNPSEMSFRSRGWTICFHRVSIVFDSIVWRISRRYIRS